jgi:hypothetical protein
MLALVGLSSGPGYAQFLTSASANSRTKALAGIEASQSSNLNAIPVSVGESLDRRIKTEVQEALPDARLMISNADAADTAVPDSPPSADYQEMYREKKTLTSWSPFQPAMPTSDPEIAVPDEPDHHRVELPILPTLGTTAEADTNFRLDSGAKPHPNARLSHPQIQQQERAKRQSREMQAQSDRQCDQLRSGALECRLKLNHAGAVSRHLPRRLAESPITTR